MQPITLSVLQLVILVSIHIVTLTAFLVSLRSRLDNSDKWIIETKIWIRDHEELGRQRERAINSLTTSLAVLTNTVVASIERINRHDVRLDDVVKLVERRLEHQ